MSLNTTGKILLWIYGGIAAALGGVGTAVTAFVAGQAMGALTFTPRQLGAIAMGGAITATAAYLKSSPLPDLKGTYPGTTPLPPLPPPQK